jgi:hypothetical protein
MPIILLMMGIFKWCSLIDHLRTNFSNKSVSDDT